MGMAMQRLLGQRKSDYGSEVVQVGSAVAAQQLSVNLFSAGSSEKTAEQCSQICSA